MAIRPPRVCPRCSRLFTGQRCSCQRAYQGSASPPSTRRWREFRELWLAEHPTCVQCGRPATDVDHVTPLAEYPEAERHWRRFDITNVQSLCHEDHVEKTKQDTLRGKTRAR